MEVKKYNLRLPDGTSIGFEADDWSPEVSDPVRIVFYLKGEKVLEVNDGATSPATQESNDNNVS